MWVVVWSMLFSTFHKLNHLIFHIKWNEKRIRKTMRRETREKQKIHLKIAPFERRLRGVLQICLCTLGFYFQSNTVQSLK